jgi:cell division protein FtsI (penicillin-binding protein 3)
MSTPRGPGPGRDPRVRLGRPSRRLRGTFLVMTGALVVLGGRLVQLQGVESSSYAALASRQALETLTLAAPRGQILDNAGAVLAETIAARDVTADPTLVSDPRSTAAALAPLTGVPVATLVSRLTVRGRYSLLAQGLTPAAGSAVAAANLPGVFVVDDSSRVYPDGALFGNIVGFLGSQGTGLAGLEYADNQLLTGRAGLEQVDVDPSGRAIPSGVDRVRPAVAGESLQLTVDSDIQWEAQQAIAAQVAATGAAGGMVVVENPATGAVLALASAPAFDSSRPGTGSSLEPAIADVYEPGSVNKVIVAAAAIQLGLLTPTSVLTIPPDLSVAGTLFHDAETHGTEHLTLTGILAVSSNIGAIEISQRVGAQRFYRFLRSFGLGSPTGLGLPGESGGILAPVAQWSGTQYATIPFGQGMAVTALQVAQVYSTVANGGVRVQPHIVAGVISPGGVLRPAPEPASQRVISAATATQLRAMLESVTTDLGTAPAAAIPGYLVAGKTGTANAVGPNGRYSGYTASFVGMAPADHPKLVVEVVLENPRTDIYGGSVSAPVFRQVMAFALQSLHIAPTGARAPSLPLTGPAGASG